MIDDAQAAGLFDGLQDPMQKLIQATQAVVVAIGAMVQLLGGQVPAAVQRMIDEFNNAQINVSVNVDVPNPNTETNFTPDGIPNKPPPPFQHGGFVPESNFGQVIRVAERGTGGEYMIPAKHIGNIGGQTVINIYPLPHQDPRQIAEEANRLQRLNTRGRRSQSGLQW